ncbi:oleate-activated transcription factor 1 [Aspergillus udagawae]|nr:oleate-activated transcription factor 1 [Aspergillus udagawae]GFG14073.1 oleate-activated transcription factor 1 [Aspergillus udagawae]
MPSSPQSPNPTPATTSKRPAPRGTAAYPRKRAVTACQVCRARRTKCDNLKPSCSFCLKVGAKCIQSPVDLSSYDPASIKILERLDEIEQHILRSQGDATDFPPESPENVLPKPTVTSKVETVDPARVLVQPLENILQWQCLGLDPTTPGRQEQLSPAWSDTTNLAAVDLNAQFTGSAVDRFFTHVHVKNPILNERETRRLFTRISMHGIDWSPDSCLALLVCALGTLATPFGEDQCQTRPGTEVYQTAQSLYTAAQKRIGSVFCSGGLREAQCLFLSGVYMMSIFQREHAWRYFLQALACCQQFSFLRPGNRSGVPLQSNRIAEQAIYWSAWKSEREIRLDLQAPDFALSQAELAIYPPFFPTPPESHEVIPASDPTAMAMDEIAQRERLAWYFYLSEISLRRLHFRVASSFLHVPVSPESDLLEELAKATEEHEEQAQEWITALPAILSLQAPPENDDISHFILRGHLLNFYEMIYWPFIDAAINRTGCQHTHRWSPLLCSLVQKGLHRHVERMYVNQPGFYHRHHGTVCLIRSCNRSALTLLAAASVVQSSLEQGVPSPLMLPENWKHAVALAIDLNSYWEGESADCRFIRPILELLWARVRILDTA